MPSIVKSLRQVADPTRLRILMLLEEEELSVAELQEILAMGQSRISTQLSQLKGAGLLADRRTGKSVYYRLRSETGENSQVVAPIMSLARIAVEEIEECVEDRAALKLVIKKRDDKVRAYFDRLAGKFGREYCPGRSWKGLAETLLKLMPPLVIADLGAGEGTFSQLLAQRAKKVIAVDNSKKMVSYASKIAKKNGFKNLEFRQGDIQEPPIKSGEVDLAFFSQALHHAQKPEVAVQEAYRITKKGGRIVILDLLKHSYEQAKELYADVWLGFSEAELSRFLEEAGFVNIEISIVDKEKKSPHFQTLLATADRV